MGRQKKEAAKAYPIKISLSALRNIDEITGYVAFVNQQPLNAITIGDAIFETIDRIALHPLAFRECEELPTKGKIYRRAVCYSWSIIYRFKDNEIVILGIIHQSRRPSVIHGLKKIK